MHIRRGSLIVRGALVAVLVIALALPLLALAQSSAELSATIRAELLKDPRTAGMSEAQVDAMVSALAEEAQAQGITPYDITWRPSETAEGSAGPATECGYMPQLLCNMNKVFGFAGGNPTIPIILGICSALLIFILAEMIEHHIRRERALAAVQPPRQY